MYIQHFFIPLTGKICSHGLVSTGWVVLQWASLLFMISDTVPCHELFGMHFSQRMIPKRLIISTGSYDNVNWQITTLLLNFHGISGNLMAGHVFWLWNMLFLALPFPLDDCYSQTAVLQTSDLRCKLCYEDAKNLNLIKTCAFMCKRGGG
jgi:hypothetical protein